MEGSTFLALAAGMQLWLLQGTWLSVHSSAFRYTLCLTRCFLRLDVSNWPALHFAFNHTYDHLQLAIALTVVDLNKLQG